MGPIDEQSALHEVRLETDSLSELVKTFYDAVTQDPKLKRRANENRRTLLEMSQLKPITT